MNASHFKNLPQHLCFYLSKATLNICAAVCWFSHRDIFEVLLDRLRAGIKVELLLEYDSQNIRDGGLDFQQFVQAGGQLWAYREAGLMHHKFVLVDDQNLVTGSFNWTYNSNAENLLVTDDAATFESFCAEYNRQKAIAQRIFQVRRADVKVFTAFPLFENTHFSLTDLRKKVSRGVCVWIVRLDKLNIDFITVFSENQIPFDTTYHLSPFWNAFRIWDETLFDEEMEHLLVDTPEYLVRDLRCWARRIKIGDVVFATGKHVQKTVPLVSHPLLAVGIIQSHPQPFVGKGFSSFRAVQWLKIMEGMPYFLSEKTSGQAVTRYRGSALRVLQEVFG